MSKEYYLVEGDQKNGPYTFTELINSDIDIYTELVTDTDDTPVYASYLPEFSEYFEKLGYIFPTENNIAQAGWRTLAFIIDYFIVSAISILVLIKLGLMALPVNTDVSSMKDLEALTSKNVYAIEICVAIIYLVYNLIFESTLRGSLGKMACGLKVVDEDGLKPSLPKIFLRNLGALLVFHILGMIVTIVSFFLKPVRQTWYERLTRTFVIKPEN